MTKIDSSKQFTLLYTLSNVTRTARFDTERQAIDHVAMLYSVTNKIAKITLARDCELDSYFYAEYNMIYRQRFV